MHTLYEYAQSCSGTELLCCSHLATLADFVGTAVVAVEFPVIDPIDQRLLERFIVWLAIRPDAALPLQYVTRAVYLHQHLVRPRRRREILIESVIEDFRGPRPCWQDPVLETLHDERGFAQLLRDVEVPAVARERRRAVEAAGRAGGLAPRAPRSIVLHDLVPDLLLSALDDTAGASIRGGIHRFPEVLRRGEFVQRQREGGEA